MSNVSKESQSKLGLTKGLRWSVYEVYGAQFASFFISIILARLLSPKDFGLVGIAMGAIAVLRSFVSLGFSEALIQDRKASSSAANSIFTLNLLTGILTSLCLFLSAPILSKYFDNPELLRIIQFLSILNLIEGTAKVQSALFTKTLNFRTLAIRKLIAQLFSGILAVILAIQGFGVYALVAQFLARETISTILLWKQPMWRPKLELRVSELNRLRPIAQYSFITGMLNRTLKELFTFSIAKSFTITQLGLYSKANSALDFFSTGVSASINKFLFPVLSGIQVDEVQFKKRFMEVYYFALTAVLIVTSTCYVSAESIITVLYGQKWIGSIFIFKCILIKGVTYTHYSVVKSAILAKSKVREGYIYDNIKRFVELSSLVPLLFGNFNLFLHWFIVTQIINIIVQSALVHRAINFSYEELLGFLLSNILLFTVGVLLFEHVFNSFDNILLRDLLKTLSIWLFILLKLVLFDRSKLLDIRNISLKILSFKR